MLKGYYEKQKRIIYLKRRYERLGDNIKETEQCISNANHTLEVLLPSQRYDLEKVSASKSGTSPQERALLQSEQRMEQKIKDFYNDQEECLLERYALENECEDLSILLESLDKDIQLMCELRYGLKKSFRYIGDRVNADGSTVKRRMDKLSKKITEELELIA